MLAVGLLLLVPPTTVFAVGDPVTIRETGISYTTLEEAVTAANGMPSATIEISGSVTVTSSMIVTSNITIVGAGGPHAVTISITATAFQLQSGGSLTLGDGTAVNLLTFSGLTNIVSVTNGAINIKDGVSLIDTTSATSHRTVYLKGPDAHGTISGGHIEGFTALYLEGGATIDTISGGELWGTSGAVEATGSHIGIISGGTFSKTSTAVDRSAFHVDHDTQIEKISGGKFTSVFDPALLIIRGGWIGEISGGSFATDSPNHGAVSILSDTSTTATGIGTISGGYFKGATPTTGAAAGIGLWLIQDYARINTITGGIFEGERAIENDTGAVITEISGGTFTGVSQGTRGNYGIMNVGQIGKISGTANIVGKNAGIWNYAGSRIGEISGGTIASSGASATGNGISNAGIIGKISGGTFIGDWSAVSNDINSGTLNIITSGVFWAKNYTVIYLGAAPLLLEPGNTSNIGFGRYHSGNANIFSNDALVTYPDGYHMSVMTMSVNGIAGVPFRYLVGNYNVNYTVTGDAPATFSPLPDNAVYEPGVTVAVAPGLTTTQASKGGVPGVWVFKGWTTDDPAVTGSTFTMPFNDITFTGTWAFNPTDYDVTYTVTGDAPATSSDTPDSAPYQPGTAVTVAPGLTTTETTHNGVPGIWTFNGWITPDASVIDGAFTMPGQAVTLTGTWNFTPTYTVTYSGNGSTAGTAPSDSGAYKQNDSVTVFGNLGNLTKNGYIFLGWSADPNAAAAEYSSGSAFTMPGNDVILYAVWEKAYTLTYDANGGTGSDILSDIPSLTPEEILSLLATGITRDGYIFLGWNTEPDGSGIAFVPGDTLVLIDHNITLYAQWRLAAGPNDPNPPVTGDTFHPALWAGVASLTLLIALASILVFGKRKEK